MSNSFPPQPGWYPDPDGTPQLRYFDGNNWLDHYAPLTQAELAPSGPQPARPLGRFLARLIDGIIVGIALVPLVLAFRVLADMSAASAFVRGLVVGLMLGLATFGYFVVFEVRWGWTPGKKLLGLTVHGPGGAPKPDLKQSAVRNAFQLLWIVPNDPYEIGSWLVTIAWIAIGVTIAESPTKQGIHDRWAGGTQVLKR